MVLNAKGRTALIDVPTGGLLGVLATVKKEEKKMP